MATGDSRDQPVPHYVYRWHRCAGFFGLGERQTHILEHQRHDESRCVRLSDDLIAVDFMRAAAEHRAGHHVDERLGIESALTNYSDDLSQHLQRGRSHHVTEQLDQVRVFGIGAHDKCFLSETVE